MGVAYGVGKVRRVVSRTSARAYLQKLRQSGLVEADALEAVLRHIEPEQLSDYSPSEPLAQAFIQAGCLTPWQNEKLALGRDYHFFLGKYKLLRPLGRGGMGRVYLAEHIRMHRQVAIKVLSQKLLGKAEHLQRFHREAQAIASLDHRNIVQAYTLDNQGELHYLVMEFVDGEDLRQRVERLGPLEFAEAADFIRQAADGLEHAHQRGIIHRDIKPANLLVDTQGVVKLLDLGLAALQADDAEPEKHVVGTAEYLAPEQAVLSAPSSVRADIYSLGCSFYFLLTGRAPFESESLAEVLLKHQTIPPPALQTLRDETPAELAEICSKMMAKNPADRFASAAEVREKLSSWLQPPAAVEVPEDSWLDGEPVPAVQLKRVADEQVLRNRAIWLGGGAFACLLILFSTLAGWQKPTPSKPAATIPTIHTPLEMPLKVPQRNKSDPPPNALEWPALPNPTASKKRITTIESVSFLYLSDPEDKHQQFVIEAESFNTNQGHADSHFEPIPGKNYSSKRAMQWLPNQGWSYTADQTPSLPRLVYRLEFRKGGAYHLWVLGQGSDPQGNRCVVQANRQQVGELLFPPDALRWQRMKFQNKPATIEYVRGHKGIALMALDDGLILDKILLTLDPKYIPQNLGPDESKKR